MRDDLYEGLRTKCRCGTDQFWNQFVIIILHTNNLDSLYIISFATEYIILTDNVNHNNMYVEYADPNYIAVITSWLDRVGASTNSLAPPVRYYD